MHHCSRPVVIAQRSCHQPALDSRDLFPGNRSPFSGRFAHIIDIHANSSQERSHATPHSSPQLPHTLAPALIFPLHVRLKNAPSPRRRPLLILPLHICPRPHTSLVSSLLSRCLFPTAHFISPHLIPITFSIHPVQISCPIQYRRSLYPVDRASAQAQAQAREPSQARRARPPQQTAAKAQSMPRPAPWMSTLKPTRSWMST